ncbi:hypothetical protein [Niabella sp.]|uniref:hypothetical protein n=1 Tax=Niabella sp. TaxID=1962976 RepID=UPI0026260EBB|nr:hypothetical protein [Niabella sp.]
MKSVIPVFILLLITLSSAGQLNDNSRLLKEKYPELYSYLNAKASKKWNDDYEMIIYDLNTQSDAWKGMVLHSDLYTNRNIFLSVLKKWTDNSCSGCKLYNNKLFEKANANIKTGNWSIILYGVKGDWQMIKYEYENQVKAKEDLDLANEDEYTKLRRNIFDQNVSKYDISSDEFKKIIETQFKASEWVIDNRKQIINNWKPFLDIIIKNLDMDYKEYNLTVLNVAAKKTTKYDCFYQLLRCKADWVSIKNNFIESLKKTAK